MLLCVFLCQIQKGKLHGSIDVGLSVMSVKKRARRIDLDTEEHIYHLKVCVIFFICVHWNSVNRTSVSSTSTSFSQGIILISFFFSCLYVKVTLNLSWKVFSSKCLHRLFFDAVNWLSPNSVCVFVSCSFKVKSPDVFDIWVCKLRNHRLFRQNEIVRSPRDATLRTFPPTAAAESPQNTPSSTHQNKVTAAHSCPLFVCFFIFEGLSVVIIFH